MRIVKHNAPRLAAAVVALTALITLAPQSAEAHGRGGFRGRPIIGGGFYSPYFGFGWGPYWGPWSPYWGWGAGYRPAGGIDPSLALVAGVGAVELNVKPGQAEVWVDGKYVGEARDLDGYPSLLWLKEGAHRVQLYKGGYVTFDEQIEVQAGQQKELKARLDKGESAPPGVRPERRKTTVS